MIDSQVKPALIVQASKASNGYQAALAYQKLNISVLPLRGKQPALGSSRRSIPLQFIPSQLSSTSAGITLVGR